MDIHLSFPFLQGQLLLNSHFLKAFIIPAFLLISPAPHILTSGSFLRTLKCANMSLVGMSIGLNLLEGNLAVDIKASKLETSHDLDTTICFEEPDYENNQS